MSIIKGIGGIPEKPDDHTKKTVIKKDDASVTKTEFTTIPSNAEQEKQAQLVKQQLDNIGKKMQAPAQEHSAQDVEKMIEAAKVKAAQLYANAKEEAKKIIDSAKLLVQSRLAEAQKDGFEQGLQEGRAAGKEELAGLVENLKDAFGKLLLEKEEFLERAKQEIANLTLACVKEILEEEIKTNPEVVLSVAKKAVELARGASTDEVIVYVNPEDKKIVEDNKALFAGMIDIESLRVKSDPSVSRGGCRISTNLGNVDATIETQLKALEIAFEEAGRSYEEEPQG